jgi:peptidoglycan/LPS O-acetylase OafA/YrhL
MKNAADIRNDIQLLRGVAVLLVVLFHAQFVVFSNGYLGVDIFFVISGFLMAKLYRQGTTLDFYKRRIKRLVPAYAITVVATLVVASAFLVPVDFSQLADQAKSSAIFGSNFHYWNQNSYFDKSAFNPLLHLWSIAIEVQFYLFVPFLFPLLEEKPFRTLALILASLICCMLVQTISPKTAFFLLPFRLWEFLVGAAIAWYQTGYTVKTAGANFIRILWVLVLIAVIIAAPIDPNSTRLFAGHPSTVAAITVLATSQLIGMTIPSSVTDSLFGKTLVLVGTYSYSIYLAHFPILVLWNYAPFAGTVLNLTSFRHFIVVVVLTVVASMMSYHFVERSRLKILGSPLFYLLVPLAILTAAAVLQFANAARYSPQEMNIFAAWTDRSSYRCGKVFRILNPRSGICLVGEKTGKRAALLVGNSHADSIKTSLSRVLNANGISLYFLVDNRPVIDRDGDGRQILQEAEALGLSQLIIHFSNIYDNEIYQDRLMSLVEEAQAKNIKVSVVAPVPYFDTNVPKEMFLNGPDSQKLQMSLTSHRKRTSSFLDFSERLKAKNVPIYDPASEFCSASENCIFTGLDSKPYYFDEAHLTLTGSEKLNEMFLQIAREQSVE